VSVPYPGSYVLRIVQGATYDQTFTWYLDSGQTQLANLTGYTAAAKIANGQGGTVLLDLSAYLTLGGAAGTIRLVIPAAVTAAIAWNSGVAWDLKVTAPDGTITRLLEGSVTLDKAIS
jgi:hypothetical protein